jgi:hypothetical protein
MDIDKSKRFVEFIAKKKQSGSNPTPSQFNLAVERSFLEWVMKRYGNPKEYQPGAPIPRIAYENTNKIKDDLRFLLERREFNASIGGRINVPDGVNTYDTEGNLAPEYLHLSSMRFDYVTQDEDGEITTTERDIDVLRDAEIGSVTNSKIVAPTVKSPACVFYSDYIQLYPKKPKRVIFTYLRVPVIPVWASTLVDGRPVYDPANSVDIESPDITHNEILMGTLQFLGISIREPELQMYAAQMKAEGI